MFCNTKIERNVVKCCKRTDEQALNNNVVAGEKYVKNLNLIQDPFQYIVINEKESHKENNNKVCYKNVTY